MRLIPYFDFDKTRIIIIIIIIIIMMHIYTG